jgi:hypothetical protein
MRALAVNDGFSSSTQRKVQGCAVIHQNKLAQTDGLCLLPEVISHFCWSVSRLRASSSGLLSDHRWIVIDDYFGPAKAALIRTQIDALVSEGRLLPFGYYGWHLGRSVAARIRLFISLTI